MTVAKVVDASAISALLFDEPEAQQIVERVAGAKLVAPPLLEFELANVCWKKCRRYPDERLAHLSAYRLRARFDIEGARVDLPKVLQLALDTGLTVYDAAYLWLSRELAVELVTLDERLTGASVPLSRP